jgi:hypothetical protein
MAGIFDLHLLHGLQGGWVDYRDSFAHFSELFFGVKESLLQTWWQHLNDNEPKFRAAFAPGAENFPLVVVQLESESEAEKPALGQFAYRDPDTKRAVQQIIIRQTVSVTIMSNHPEITRALHVVCRALVSRLGPVFMKQYLDVHYSSAEDLAPDDQLMAEDLGVYVRRQRYEAISEVSIPEIVAPASKFWQTLANDIKNENNVDPTVGAGLPGGVTLDE